MLITARRALMASSALVLMAASPAAAQSNDGGLLAELVVTAQKRAERLQDVPIAVTAVSSDRLEKSNFKEVTDLQYLAPNITFSSTNPVSSGGGFQIRGVGTQAFDSSLEQTVGLVVDGVAIGLPRDPGATGFADVERVEVLRGPQGTLFGKNASAGVIQILTRNPQLEETSGQLSLSFGERQERVARMVANLPLGSTAALRLSGYYDAQDGAIPYVVRATDDHVGDRENKGVRGKLLWEPNDDLTLVLAAEYQEGFSRDVPIIQTLGFNPAYNALFDGQAQRPGPQTYLSFDDGDNRSTVRLRGTSLQADYGLGEFTLTSITAFRDVARRNVSDLDHTPIDIMNHNDGSIDARQFTQEVRLTSPSGGRLEYVAGLYYYNVHSDGVAQQTGGFLSFLAGVPGLPPAAFNGRQEQYSSTESYAAFGQGAYALTEKLKLIAGLRYTNDRSRNAVVVSDVPGFVTYPFDPAARTQPYSAQVSADNISGRIGLQYQHDRNLMAYATYATGYKGPAITSFGGGVGTPVRPETVESYEAGVKSTLFGDRLTLNGSIYRSDFKDFQAQTLDFTSGPPRLGMSNAGLLRTQGAELEAELRLAAGFRAGASAAYNDAVYKDYTGACYAGQPVSPVVGQGCYMLPGSTTLVANMAGERLANAPKWSYNLNGAYERSVGADLVFDVSANWSWRDDTQTITGDPRSVVPAYGLLNANIGLGRTDGAWRLSLYGRNLLDKMYAAPVPTGLFNLGGYEQVISPGAFRTVGVNLTVNWR